MLFLIRLPFHIVYLTCQGIWLSCRLLAHLANGTLAETDFD